MSTPSIERYGSTYPGELLQLSSGEYLQAQNTNHRVSVLWSSAAPIATILERLGEVVGTPTAEATATVIVDDKRGNTDIGEGLARDVLDYVQHEATDTAYVRIDYPELTFIWRAPFRKFSTRPTALAESSISAEHLSRARLISVIGRTATPSVAARADELVGDLDVLDLDA